MLQGDIISWFWANVEHLASLVSIIASPLLVIGIIIAVIQLTASQKATKAQFLMKLIDDWQNQDLYEAISYIHELRREWKDELLRLKEEDDKEHSWSEKEVEELAKKWVEKHKRKNIKSKNEEEQELAREWLNRRKASQFLSKTGAVMLSGYIKPNELFGVIPEAGRLLIVLIPIEIQIQAQFSTSEKSIYPWDQSVPKWEFNEMWLAYLKWYKKNWKKVDHLDKIDWNSVKNC